MTESILAVVAGIAILVWGADRFVAGSAAVARNLGVSPLVIGLTIVAFGTSAPEIIVSAVAAFKGNPGLSVGNAIGSNITNIALVLGMTALVQPITVHSAMLRREFPVLLGIMLAAFLLVSDGELGRADGMILLAGLAALVWWLIRMGMQTRACPPSGGDAASCDPMGSEFEAEIPAEMPTSVAVMWFVVGLALLLVGSRALVWGAVQIAQGLGVSDIVIGIGIVGVGTSLPELAASMTSAIRNEDDIAVGNVIGSNMFNLLAVLGLPGVINPVRIDKIVLIRDFPVMAALTLALFIMAFGCRKAGRITRLEGAMLVVSFFAYQIALYKY